MRAPWRRFLAPVVLAAAALSVAAPAQFAVAATVHPMVKVHPLACPQGTNWDNVLQSCV